MTGNKLTYGVTDHGVIYQYVCVCVCVCVYLPESGDLKAESDIVSPQIELLVQTVANCTCIHMKM